MENWDRDRVLASIRGDLWRFLRASAAVVWTESVVSFDEELSHAELMRLTSAHLGLRRETWAALEVCRGFLAGMPATLERRTELSFGLVRGRVDWPQTLAARVRTGDPTVFSCERVDRRYDTPLGRLLKSALGSIARLLSLSGMEAAKHSPGSQVVGAALTRLSSEAHRTLRHPKLAHVRLVDPRRLVHQEALSRRYPELVTVVAFLADFRRMLAADSLLLHEILEEQVFAPSTNDALFELYVGAGLISGLIDAGYQISGPVTLLDDAGENGVPFASLGNGQSEVRIWWQRNVWDVVGINSKGGRWWRALHDNSIGRRVPLRPDFVVEHDGGVILLEVKLTEREGFSPERDGMREMFSYFHDLSGSHRQLPPYRGMVVAWNASGSPVRSDSPILVSDQARISETVRRILNLPNAGWV